MKTKYTQSFKIQAVEKALNRSDVTSLREVASSLGIVPSTLHQWIVKAKNQDLDTVSPQEINRMKQDKRPQDWTVKERFIMVVACDSLDDEKLSEYCREQGIYPHHVDQWKLDFVKGDSFKEALVLPAEIKLLKQENKTLKKEVNRKDKALAETAALLVLQKKVGEIWGNDEVSSQ